MIRRRTAAIVAAVVLATACSGADDAAPTTTAETDEPGDALVTLPAAAQEHTTTAPTSTRAPIEIRRFPEPNWPPVDIPTAPPVRPEALTVLVDEPPGVRYDVSPDGNWLALLDDSNRLCLVGGRRSVGA